MKQIQKYKWGKGGGGPQEGLCPAPTIINSKSMDCGDFQLQHDVTSKESFGMK